MLRLGVLLLVAGCDDLFNLAHVTAPDGTGDAGGCIAADGFAGPAVSQLWEPFGEHASLVVELRAGRLAIDMTGAANLAFNAEAGVRTFGHFDFTGMTATVEVPQIVSSTRYNAENYLELRADVDNRYSFIASKAELTFGIVVAGVYMGKASRPYDKTAHRFWRIAHASAGEIAYMTSSDGVQWVTQIAIPAEVALTRVRLGLVGGTYDGGDPDPGTAIFDNFALCPR